tara:strand:+ start:1194 stop:2510 length:1317 start_codon:yes stop_codon:yes gene_type:complete
MIEIFSIFLQLIIFLIIFSFPFTPKILNNSFNLSGYKFKIIDAHSLNIIFFLYLCLIVSFLNVNLELLFKSYLVVSIIYLFFSYKNFRFNLKKENVILFFFFIIILISIFFYIAQNLKLEWDGVNHWLEKVLIFFNGKHIEDLKNVTTHPYYPHLGSYIWALFWKNSYLGYEYFGRFFYVYLYITSIFLITDNINFKNIFYKILIILFFLIITFEPYLLAGYQEYLIFSTLIFATKYISFCNFKNSQSYKFIFLILMILYLNCWFKDEGLFYFIIFSSLFILMINLSNQSKFTFLFFITFLLLIQYMLQKYIIGIYDFPEKISLTDIIFDITNFEILIIKLSKISFHIFVAFAKYSLWIVILISIFIKIFFKQKFNIIERYFSMCLLFNLIFLIGIFFTFKNLDFMLRVSLDRLIFQTSGFYLMLILLTLDNLKIFKK